MAAVFDQILDEMKTVIEGLSLTGVSSNEVTIKKEPFDDQTAPSRGITLSVPGREHVVESGSTCQRDQVAYPVLVTMARGTGRGSRENIDEITDWREKIRRAFIHKRLTGLSISGVSDCTCLVQHQDVELPKAWRSNWDVDQMMVIPRMREPRT